jgi:hypothetical protein
MSTRTLATSVKIEEEARLIDIKIIQGCESYHPVN